MRVFMLAPLSILWISIAASPIPCSTDNSLGSDTTSFVDLIQKSRMPTLTPAAFPDPDAESARPRADLVRRTEDMILRTTLAHEHDAAARAHANAVFAHHDAMEAHRAASLAHGRAGNSHRAAHHTDAMHDHARKLGEHSTAGETHRDSAARARDYKNPLGSKDKDSGWSAQLAKFNAERSGTDAEASTKAAIKSAKEARG